MQIGSAAHGSTHPRKHRWGGIGGSLVTISENVAEASGDCLLCRSESVGVNAHRHGTVGVTETAGNCAHVVALADRHRGRPMAKIM